MIRGAVYRVDLSGARDHEQRGRRYGIVVSPSDSPLSVAHSRAHLNVGPTVADPATT